MLNFLYVYSHCKRTLFPSFLGLLVSRFFYAVKAEMRFHPLNNDCMNIYYTCMVLGNLYTFMEKKVKLFVHKEKRYILIVTVKSIYIQFLFCGPPYTFLYAIALKVHYNLVLYSFQDIIIGITSVSLKVWCRGLEDPVIISTNRVQCNNAVYI